MVSRNDVTGDSIKSKFNSDDYRNNWEKIFGKKNEEPKECKNKEKCGEKCKKKSCS